MTGEVTITNHVKIGGGNPLVLIAGPCVIETEKKTLWLAQELKTITEKLNIPFIFKSSYDKANRTSINSYRGPGLKEGLRILAKVKKNLGVPILSDVHQISEITKQKKFWILSKSLPSYAVKLTLSLKLHVPGNQSI